MWIFSKKHENLKNYSNIQEWFKCGIQQLYTYIIIYYANSPKFLKNYITND